MPTTPTAAAYPGPYAIGLTFDDDRTQIIAADGSHVASVEIDPLMPTAALLAAAPELRDALAALERIATDAAGRLPYDAHAQDALDTARALLAKLDGGAR